MTALTWTIFLVALSTAVFAVWMIGISRKKTKRVSAAPGERKMGRGEKQGEVNSVVAGRSVTVGHAQHIGARQSQQDAYSLCYNAWRLVFAVCDGMGGMAMGAEAAALAIQTMMPRFETAVEPDGALLQAINEASAAVYDLCQGKGGTTAVLAYIDKDGLRYVSAGDSRIYLFRQGNMVQLGQDHIFYYDLLKSAQNGSDMTAQEAAVHPEREHLTSYLGREVLTRINATDQPMSLQAGDVVVVMTDGVYKSLEEARMEQILREAGGARQLVAEALLAQSPRQDNLTCITVRINN